MSNKKLPSRDIPLLELLDDAETTLRRMITEDSRIDAGAKNLYLKIVKTLEERSDIMVKKGISIVSVEGGIACVEYNHPQTNPILIVDIDCN